jgi:hypothetical protein
MGSLFEQSERRYAQLALTKRGVLTLWVVRHPFEGRMRWGAYSRFHYSHLSIMADTPRSVLLSENAAVGVKFLPPTVNRSLSV